MLGLLLWVLLAVALLGLVAFVVLLVREKRIVSRRLVWSEVEFPRYSGHYAKPT
jgi:hypothetical protein